MKLKNILSQKKRAILDRWSCLIRDTYSAHMSKFLASEKDRFANPVGYTISTVTEALFDELLNGVAPEKVNFLLDKIIRIRAVQEFSPAQALSFIFLLKKAIRQEIRGEMGGDDSQDFSESLVTLESRIDEWVLLSFDIYMQCREKIYEIKANEIRNRTSRLLESANRILSAGVDGPVINAPTFQTLEPDGGNNR